MITIQQLNKSFGAQHVLRNIDLDIPSGQSIGIVGPNGSGKTTLIKTMLGLVKPDSGSISINGTVLNGNYDYRRHIGYMPQQARYPENMYASELFSFMEKLRGEKGAFRDQLVDEFHLHNEIKKPLRVLSGGNRQKVGAVLAMMFNPNILFLDEPTAGLDPHSSHIFKERVRREKQAGKTVFITSHIMSELEQLAEHVVFILDGNIRYYGSVGDLIKDNRQEHLEGAIAQMMEGAD